MSQTWHSRTWTVWHWLWHWLRQRYKLLLHYLCHRVWSVSVVSLQGICFWSSSSHTTVTFLVKKITFCKKKHDFFPNLWLKISGLLKDTFLLPFNKIIHSVVPHDWHIDQPQAFSTQYKPLLPAFKDRLFICRNRTRPLSSANQHTEMGSVQS